MAAVPCRIVDGEDDDVKEDTEDVDGKAEEDRIFTLWESNTPDKAAQEHQVVDEGGLENNGGRKVGEDDEEIPDYPTLLELPTI